MKDPYLMTLAASKEAREGDIIREEEGGREGGEGGFSYLHTMKENKRQSRFSKCVKVMPEQLIWLQENKDTKTVAGFLDKIINHYKTYGVNQREARPLPVHNAEGEHTGSRV